MRGEVIFISGPMRGMPDLGRARFTEVETKLRRLGYRVISPACLPIDLPEGRYMPICLAMLREADAVLMLNGWRSSYGANLEHDYAEQTHKAILEERDFDWRGAKDEPD